jgi:hypothetical protein
VLLCLIRVRQFLNSPLEYSAIINSMKLNILALMISIIALLVAFSNSPDTTKLTELTEKTMKIDKIEFYQEASRIMNNLIGFEQVKESQPSDKEKAKQCNENQDLIKEWGDDVSSLKNLNTLFVNSDEDAKSFLKQIESLFDQIKGDCAKLAIK